MKLITKQHQPNYLYHQRSETEPNFSQLLLSNHSISRKLKVQKALNNVPDFKSNQNLSMGLRLLNDSKEKILFLDEIIKKRQEINQQQFSNQVQRMKQVLQRVSCKMKSVLSRKKTCDESQFFRFKQRQINPTNINDSFSQRIILKPVIEPYFRTSIDESFTSFHSFEKQQNKQSNKTLIYLRSEVLEIKKPQNNKAKSPMMNSKTNSPLKQLISKKVSFKQKKLIPLEKQQNQFLFDENETKLLKLKLVQQTS